MKALYIWVSGVVCVSCLSACSPEYYHQSQAAPVASIYGVDHQAYYVRSGDSINTIAHQFGMTPEQVVAINHIKRPYRIYVGQRLALSHGHYAKLNPAPTSQRAISSTYAKTSSQMTQQASMQMQDPDQGEPSHFVRVNQAPAATTTTTTKSKSVGHHAVMQPVRSRSASQSQKAIKSVKSTQHVKAKSRKNQPKATNKTVLRTPKAEAPTTFNRKSNISTKQAMTKPKVVAKVKAQTIKKAVPPKTKVVKAKPKPSPMPSVEAKPKSSVAKAKSPFAWTWPTQGKVIQSFSPANQSDGIEIAGKIGQSIKASAPGDVVFSGNDVSGYGNLVIVKHTDGYISVYGNNQKLLVKEGDHVKAGEAIATMGDSNHGQVGLYFAIRKAGSAQNPLAYLPSS